MENFVKILNPVMCDTGRSFRSRGFVKVRYENGRLSISGVIGPTIHGGCYGSCGQCVDDIANGEPASDWTKDMVVRLCSIWKEWHLNDMRPYCHHQKMAGWDKASSEVITVNGKETTRGWVYEKEHELGLLGKACPVCGYKYGTAWKNEEVPEEVLKWLYNLPESKVKPAWS